jgi:sialidase-1
LFYDFIKFNISNYFKKGKVAVGMIKVGKTVFEMPPAEGNPRNSEGAFIELSDGRLMFVYSHYIGDSYADDAAAAIAKCYSSDRGETWSQRQIIVMPDEHKVRNIMSVSLLRMKNGDIGLFYLIRYGWHDMRLHLRRSSDEGETWGEPICCINAPGYFVTNNDRVVRLSSGRLIIPAARHNKLRDSEAGSRQWDSKAVSYFYYSDDDGYTWNEARNFTALNSFHTASGLQEPGVVELKNGVLWAWARTDLGTQYEMFSIDSGESWTSPEPSVFTSPCSPLSMKRIPKNGYLFAVWNPIPNYQTRAIVRGSGGRTPLVAAVSKDEGKTWDNFVIVEDDPDAGYCYTAIYFIDDAVLLAYCAGSADDGTCLARLNLIITLLLQI